MDRTDPPNDLSEESQALWAEVVAHEPARWLPQRLALLHEGLRAKDRADQARRVLEEDGLCFKGDSGMLRLNPAARVEKDASSLFLRIWRALGLEWR